MWYQWKAHATSYQWIIVTFFLSCTNVELSNDICECVHVCFIRWVPVLIMFSRSDSNVTGNPVEQPQSSVYPGAQMMPPVRLVQAVPVLHPLYPSSVPLVLNQVPRIPLTVLPPPPPPSLTVNHPPPTTIGRYRASSVFRKVFRIGTVCCNWPVSAHASQAFSMCTVPIRKICRVFIVGDDKK